MDGSLTIIESQAMTRIEQLYLEGTRITFLGVALSVRELHLRRGQYIMYLDIMYKVLLLANRYTKTFTNIDVQIKQLFAKSFQRSCGAVV